MTPPEPGPGAMGAAIDRARHVHLVGIGGSGMGALATLLLQMDRTVSGSDLAEGGTMDRLRAAGARVSVGHRAENVAADVDYVVRSSAIPTDNPEVAEAGARGLPNRKLAETVGELMQGRLGVAIAGTHGKTTTTALVGWLLAHAGLDPLVLVGAEAVNFGASARAGSGPMVVEADEYDRRFLHLAPEVAVVTSVETDHLDYFRDIAEIRATFQAFADTLPPHGRLVVCRDDPNASALRSRALRETYGLDPAADWWASEYTPRPGGGARFRVHCGGRSWPAESPLSGEHNVRNALAALCVADALGVGLQTALAGLAAFLGTRRRFETRGHPGGVWVVDDYAHHPTAIAATLRAARQASAGGAVWAVFQPHTTNRTAALLEEFARSFGPADHALLLPIYRPAGRETAARPVTSADLAARLRSLGHQDARVVDSFEAVERLLAAEARPGDVVLTMGAGDVTLLAERLAQTLEVSQ